MKAINLLPPDLRGTPRSAAAPVVAADEPGGIGAFAVLGALAVCVIALAAYVLTTNTVKDRTAQLEATESQATATAQRVAQLKPYVDFQSMAETRIQTVRDLASSRFDWEQALRDISRALPAAVSLESLNGSISSQSGGSTVRSAITAPAIELKGCTRGQLSVATLMSRLRNVDGVTRVSLSKSTKADEQAEDGATTAAAVTTLGSDRPLCGDVRAPSFELVMFFERSEVPETVQEITVQPQAQTASTGAPGTATASPETSGATQDPTATPSATPEGATTP